MNFCHALLLVVCATLAASDACAQQLANLSTRSRVGSDAGPTIVGFVVGQSSESKILVRAVGPTLTSFGVPRALSDPKIEVIDASGHVIAANDNWSPGAVGGETTFDSVGAFGLGANTRDAAVLLTQLTAGAYTAVVSGVGDESGVALVEVYDVTGNARLLNLSARAQVGTGSDIVISGLVIAPGDRIRRFLVRAAGPALAGFGVPGTLANPAIEVINNANPDDQVASNDNWDSSSYGAVLRAAFRQAGAFDFVARSEDAALVADLAPGNYSIHVRGVGDTTGVALVEVYDITSDTSVTPLEPPATGSVLTAYEMLGNPVFCYQQGDLTDSIATKYTFTVMKTGRLKQIAVFTQGARGNAQWGDAHVGGTGGSYHVRVYAPASGGSVAGTTGNPGGSMTLLGSTPTAWFPAKLIGSFQTPENAWTLQTGKGSAYLANQTIPDSVSEHVGGGHRQSWNTRSAATQDYTHDSITPPAGFLGTTRAYLYGIVYVDIKDTTGADGIAVTQGQVLCISQENQDANPTVNFTHNNEAHASYAPLDGYGLSTPLDPNAKVFTNDGNQDWRKAPHFSVNIDDVWYGQPQMARYGNNTTDDTDVSGACRLMYDGRYARQVITPPVGYNRTINKLWVNAVLDTEKTGYKDTNGRLQARILRAPVGSSTWTQVWPSSDWSTFPTGTFAAHNGVLTVDGSVGRSKITDPTLLSRLLKYGKLNISPSLAVTGAYHYAVELRVDPTTAQTAIYVASSYNPYDRYFGDMPTGRTVWNYPANSLAYGSSGQSYNRAEKSDDSGATWSYADPNSKKQYSIALEPDPL